MNASVLPGAEPGSWPGWVTGGPDRARPDGALVLHGFTGTPQSVRGLGLALAGAGLSVELPLLPGHGTSLEEMAATRWEDWSAAAETAWARLAGRCRRTVVVGLSMGGTLACWLAARHPEVAGVVAVNPLIEPPAQSFLDIIEGVLASGLEVAPAIGSDIAEPGRAEMVNDGAPLRAALSLYTATVEVTGALGRITCPVLLLSSRQDHVVPTTSGDLLAAGAGGPVERVWLERSYHVATLDYDRHEIEARAVAFARRVLQGAG